MPRLLARSLPNGVVSTAGWLRCVDDLFRIDGTCDAAADESFPHFTALPPANDAKAVCVEPSPLCSARAEQLRATADAAGNLLIPMEWSGVLLPRTAAEESRSLGHCAPDERDDCRRGLSRHGADMLRVPNDKFLASLSPAGGRLAPVFEARAGSPAVTAWRCSARPTRRAACCASRVVAPRSVSAHLGEQEGKPCTDADDCPGGSCGAAVRTGSDAAGQPCEADADCGSGERGPALFELPQPSGGRRWPDRAAALRARLLSKHRQRRA